MGKISAKMKFNLALLFKVMASLQFFFFYNGMISLGLEVIILFLRLLILLFLEKLRCIVCLCIGMTEFTSLI